MKIETPILKRLGPVPFWHGERKCLDSLEVMYRKAIERAERLVLETSGTESPRPRRR